MNLDLMKIVNEFKDDADWVGVREYFEEKSVCLSRNGITQENYTKIDHGIMIEVNMAGHISYGATSDLSTDSLKKTFRNTKANALLMATVGMTKFADGTRTPQKGSYIGEAKKSLSEIDIVGAQDILKEVSKTVSNDDSIIDGFAYFIFTKARTSYACSAGSSWDQNYSYVTKDISASAKKGSDVQKRTLGMEGKQIGAEAFDKKFLCNEAERIRGEAIELLSAAECPSETMDLIITPDQLYLQVHESIGHPLEIDRILGDERNYAGWSFVSLDDFGKLRYGPDILNVTFDPTLDGAMASYAFDDTGTKAEKVYLIQDGILKAGIGGRESQARSGIPGVSSQRSTSWNRAPIDRMGNINIEPGDSSLDEMIKSTERGVLMETNRSWSIDDYRNKFQFGCERAHLIVDGEVKEVLKNPNYRGSTVEFWNNLSHVGNKETYKVWGSPYCGKGEPNQIIRVGHAVPTCKFTNIEVFGGA